MREQIACLTCQCNGRGCQIVGKPLSDGYCGVRLRKADQILTPLIEEIQKVRSTNPYSADEDTDEFFAFDLACVKILKKMEEK